MHLGVYTSKKKRFSMNIMKRWPRIPHLWNIRLRLKPKTMSMTME